MSGILTKRNFQSPGAETPVVLTNDPPQFSPGSAVSPEALPTEAQVMAEGIESDAVHSEEGDDGRQMRIREAAYAAYERRGGQPGNEVDDWLEGERAVDRDRRGIIPTEWHRS
jgi:hypothetical protein